VMTTLMRMTRRAMVMAFTGAVALTLFAATAVFADEADDTWTDGEFTLSIEVTAPVSETLRLGIRWY
jgi:hypothetical protein